MSTMIKLWIIRLLSMTLCSCLLARKVRQDVDGTVVPLREIDTTIIQCNNNKSSCSVDLKFTYFNESYSYFLSELVHNNDDLPLECRTDTCRETVFYSERKGNLKWPDMRVGERYVQKCYYSSNIAKYAYVDCKLGSYKNSYWEVFDDNCPEPPFTEELKKIKRRTTHRTLSCFEIGMSFQILNTIYEEHQSHPIFKDDYSFVMKLFFIESRHCWPSATHTDQVLADVVHLFLDMIFSSNFRKLWLNEVSNFAEVVLYLKSSFETKKNYTKKDVYLKNGGTDDEYEGKNLMLIHRIVESGFFNHNFTFGTNDSVSLSFSWGNKESNSMEIKSMLFVHFDDLNLMNPVRYKREVLYPFEYDGGQSNDTHIPLSPLRPVKIVDSSFVVLRQQLREVGSLVYFEYAPLEDVRSNDSSKLDSKDYPNANAKPILEIVYESTDFLKFNMTVDDVFCARYPYEVKKNTTSLFDDDKWVFDCNVDVISKMAVRCTCSKSGYISLLTSIKERFAMPRLNSFGSPDLTVFLGFPYCYELYMAGMVLRAISIAALIITIITYLVFKNTRKGIATHILINLCFSIICLLALLYVAESRSNIKKECRVYNILRYYFIFVSLMWNGIEAHSMYRMLVKVFHSHVLYFVRKSAVVAWGVPCVMVVIVLLADFRAFDGTYAHCVFSCTLKDSTRYYAWLIPMSVIILHNLVVFIMVVRVLCQKNPAAAKNEQDKSSVLARLSGAFAILVLLGVPWVLSAFAALKTEENTHLYKFQGVAGVIVVVFVSLQGLFIFLFHCVKNPLVRDEWKSTLSRSQKSGTLSGSSNLTKSCSTEGHNKAKVIGNLKIDSIPQTIDNAIST